MACKVNIAIYVSFLRFFSVLCLLSWNILTSFLWCDIFMFCFSVTCFLVVSLVLFVVVVSSVFLFCFACFFSIFLVGLFFPPCLCVIRVNGTHMIGEKSMVIHRLIISSVYDFFLFWLMYVIHIRLAHRIKSHAPTKSMIISWYAWSKDARKDIGKRKIWKDRVFC